MVKATEKKHPKTDNIVKSTVEAISAADEHKAGFEPNLDDLFVDEIKRAALNTNRNRAKQIEYESRRDLERAQTEKPVGTPLWGMGHAPQTSNPVLDMVKMLPEDERAAFIKERSSDLMGSMVPGSQYLQRIANTDSKGGLGDMAQMMLAMTAANSEQQKNMIDTWLTLQSMMKPAKPENGDNKDIIQAMMAMAQAIVTSNQQSGNAAIERIEKVYAEKANSTKEYYATVIEMQKTAYTQQIEFMQQMAQRQSSGITKEDLLSVLTGFKEVTGVELKPDRNIEAEQARYNFQLEQQRAQMEQERINKEHEERVIAAQVEATKWQAISGLGAAVVDGLRLQKKITDGKGAGSTLRSVVT